MPFAYEGADIFIATQVAIRHCNKKFGLVAVLGIDNALNHIDFRSAEKAFQALTCLAHISLRQMVIQTNMPGHYAFNALASRDYELFIRKNYASAGNYCFLHTAILFCQGARI